MATESDVMEALGRALFAAQNFELNVGTLVLMMATEAGNHEQFMDLDGQRNVRAIQKFIDEIDRLPLGKLKGKLQGMRGIGVGLIERISAINIKRRRLVHYFVIDYHEQLQTEDGRAGIVETLRQDEVEFREAWLSLYQFLAHQTLQRRVQGL